MDESTWDNWIKPKRSWTKREIRNYLGVNNTALNAVLENKYDTWLNAFMSQGRTWRQRALQFTMTWMDTPQGFAYWNTICFSYDPIPEEALSFLRWVAKDEKTDPGEDE